jgi:hypothetical protein
MSGGLLQIIYRLETDTTERYRVAAARQLSMLSGLICASAGAIAYCFVF